MFGLAFAEHIRSRVAGSRLALNPALVLALTFAQVFMIFVPVAVPFFQSHGLSMAQVFQLQAWFGLVVLLMEVPSGYLADVFGRRGVILAGSLFWALGNSWLLFADGFAGLIVFETLLGIGIALLSGADLALLYDSEVQLGRPLEARARAVSRHYVMQSGGQMVAALCCSLLMLHSLEAVILAQVFVGWVPLAIGLLLVEPAGARLAGGSHLENMRSVGRVLARGEPLLRWILPVLCVWSLTTFFSVWLMPAWWEIQGIGPAWFGVFWAGYAAAGLVSGHFADAIERRVGAPLLLVAVAVLPAIGYAVLALGELISGVLFGAVFLAVRGVGVVCLRSALNSRIEATHRATVNSLAQFGFRGLFMVFGPLVGAGLDLFGMAPTLWLLAGLTMVVNLALVLPLAARVRIRSRAQRRTAGVEIGNPCARRASQNSSAAASSEPHSNGVARTAREHQRSMRGRDPIVCQVRR